MAEQFTPGPWAVNPFSAQVDCAKRSEKGGLLPIAQMLWPTAERDEAETNANAHLIAAAPDLYEALKAAVANSDAQQAAGHYLAGRIKALYEQATSALAKARGETK